MQGVLGQRDARQGEKLLVGWKQVSHLLCLYLRAPLLGV